MNAPKTPQRRGLGRGLGSLIPTAAPADEHATPAPLPVVRRLAAGRRSGPARRRRSPAPTSPSCRSTRSGRTPSSRARSSTRRRWPSWSTRSARSGCSSRSWSARRADQGDYELVMGERRWRAAQEAGLDAIPAIVRETGDDDMLRDALLENLHRSQLNPLEEAAAYAQMLEDFGCTHDELASRIGRSRPQISNTLRLLKLSPAVQRRVAAGVLSAGHARALLAVEDADLQDRLAQRVVAEGISVRGLEEIVAVGDTGRGAGPGGPAQAVRARPGRPRRAALRPAGDPGEGRPRPDQGQDHRRVRLDGRPAADRRRDGPAEPQRPPDLRLPTLVSRETRRIDRRFVDKAIKPFDRLDRRGDLAALGAASGPPAARFSSASSRAASSSVGALAAVRRREPPGAGRLLVGGVGRDRLAEQAGHHARAARRSRRPGRRRWGAAARRPGSRWACRGRSPWGGPWSSSAGCPRGPPGTSGTPASAAIRTAPVLNSLSSIAREMVASGKMPTASPARRYSTRGPVRRVPGAAVDLDVVHRAHQRTGPAVVEELPLGHEPDLAARTGWRPGRRRRSRRTRRG